MIGNNNYTLIEEKDMMMYKKILYTTMSALLLYAPFGGMYAHAQSDAPVIVGGSNNSVSGRDIDTSRGITLTVKKKQQNPFDENQSQAPQIKGVEFTISRVEGVNVLDDTVREKVMKEYSYDYIQENNMKISRVTSGVTDDKGIVTFEGLQPGLYILEQGNNTVPEVIMLPLVSVDGTSFEYDDIIVTKNIPRTTTPKIPPTERTTRPDSTPRTTPRVTMTPGIPPTMNQEIPDDPKDPRNDSTPQNSLGDDPVNTPNSQKGGSTPSSTPPAAPGIGGGGGTPLYPGGPIVDTGGAVAIAAGATILGTILVLLFSGSTGFAGLRLISRNAKE